MPNTTDSPGAIFGFIPPSNPTPSIEDLTFRNAGLASAQSSNVAAQIAITFQVTDLTGNSITQIAVGQQFELRAYVQDIRSNPTQPGVAAAYTDVTFNGALASVQAIYHSTAADPNPNPPAYYFSNSVGGSFATSGLIDEAGGFQSATQPLGAGTFLLFTAKLTATGSGALTFTADPADMSPSHDSLTFNPPVLVPTDAITYGTASLTVVSNGTAPEIDVRGGGFTIASGDVTPSTTDATDFGNVDVNTGAAVNAYGIVNLGTATLALTGSPVVQISGANASDFTVTYMPPTSSIAPGGYTVFQITFNPSGAGLRTATVTIGANDSDEGTFTFKIQGTGTGVLATPEIDVRGGGITINNGDNTPSVADATDFGNVDVNTGKVVTSYGIVNLGAAALNLIGNPLVQISGANAADFTVTYMPPTASIAAGGYTVFQITFDPSGAGLRTALVTINNNDSDEGAFTFAIQGTATGVVIPQEIDVRGGGVTIVSGDTTPSAADATDFGNVDVNTGAPVISYGIVNLGNSPLTLTGNPLVQISGANASDFTVTYLPTSTVSGGNYTVFQITFNPSAPGLRTAQVTINNNDSDEGSFTFRIQGTGAGVLLAPEIDVRGGGFTIASGDTTPSLTDATDFGNVNVASGTLVNAYGIVNLGNAALSLTGGPLVQISGANASDFTVTYMPPTTSIAAGGYTVFQVTFNPSAPGLRTATVTVSNNDSDEGTFTFRIQGTGV